MLTNNYDLIARLRLLSPKPRQLKLSVEKKGASWVISDHGKPIATVVRDVGIGGALLEVLKFSPDAPDRPLVLPPYDYHYATRIGYGATFNWSVGSMFTSPDAEDALELIEREESRLLFVHSGKYKDGSTVRAALRVSYDDAIGQYAYDLTWDIASTRDAHGEFSNLFHRNLMHSDMKQREYDYGCYVRDGGSWEKFPITTMVTGMQQDRLMRIPIQIGGGAGHINRSGVVPMLVIRKTNVPVHCGSCNVCYDLHQTATVSAGKPARIETRFVDVGPVAASNPAEVKTIPLDDFRAYPFKHGEVCDFESTISRREPWAGGVWWCEMFPGSAIVDDCGHSGTHSLRLDSATDAEVSISPYLSCVITENHANYEMSAWVKLEGDAETSASIEFRAFRFTASNPVSIGIASIYGSQDWIQLKTVINTCKVEAALPYLRIKGKGRAWFDDILVRGVPSGPSPL